MVRDDSPVTLQKLRELAQRCGFTISPRHENAYLLGLRSSYSIATLVNDLPDYLDPRLLPLRTRGGAREYGSPHLRANGLGAWCHVTSLEAISPDSDLLKGRSVVVKDTIAVGHIPQTLGTLPQFVSKTEEYPRSPIDATVVRRLLLSGATIKGTSTCENFSLSPMSYTSASGPVHNPWQQGYNSGGSSSGSAALVGLRVARRSGMKNLDMLGPDVDLALGGDQAGSIRVPAAYCGIYGLKPTFGLVPYTGIAGLLPMIDHVGPLATSVEDIALLLTAMAGYDGLDPRMSPESPVRGEVEQYHEKLPAFTARVLSNKGLVADHPVLRVGLITESFFVNGISDEVAGVVCSTAIQHFSAAGAQITKVSIPMHLQGAAIWTAAVRNQMASSAFGGRAAEMLTHDLPHLSLRWPADQETYDVLTLHNPAVILTMLGEELLTDSSILPNSAQKKAHRHVLELRRAYDDALQNFDVLVTPTTPTVAPPLPKIDDDSLHPPSSTPSTVENLLRLAMGSTNNTSPFNASGHPALSVPCGWARAAQGSPMLPVGMQIIGKRFDDLEVLKAAKLFEIGGGKLGARPT